MSTTLTVLGSCGAWPEPGRACSGYLVEHEDFRIVLDLGYGTLSRLLELLHAGNADGLDAVAVTHRHPDHMVDLHGLMRARWFGARRAEPLQLLGPQGVVDSLVELEEGSREAVDAVFTHTPLPSPPLQLGPFAVHSQGLPHFVPNAGIRLSVEGGPSLAYTGDTGPSPALAELARDVDLLVAEASSRSQRADTPRSPQGPNFTSPHAKPARPP